MADRTQRHAAEPREDEAKAIARAVEVLNAGGIVAFPTETVYGLGADARRDEAVARVFAAKGRPAHNPLIAHVAGRAAAERLALFDAEARALADAFWPGPLSLVLPARPGAASPLATAGLPTIALRCPAHPLAAALLRAFDGPLVGPSANRSGRLSPTDAAAVRAELGGAVDLVLDGGPCAVGVESTIVKLEGGAARLLRPGGVTVEALERALDRPLLAADGGVIEAPGMLASHYAPNAALRLNARAADAGEAWLGFGPDPSDAPALAANLSPTGDLEEAARTLFARLRALDAAGPARIAVAPVPESGLGRAVNDRLRRAAAPRA